MARDIDQVYIDNPTTTVPDNALLYLGLYPYGAINDSAIKIQDLFAGTSVVDRQVAIYSGTSGKKIINALTTIDSNGKLSTDSISLANTSTTAGGVQIGGSNFLSDYGTRNTFVGSGAGNLTLTTGSATDLTAVGYQALQGVTTGQSISVFGVAAGKAITTALNCAIFGAYAGQKLTTVGGHAIFGDGAGANAVTSSTLTLFGNSAGSNYTTNESYNIIIGPNPGVLGESNTIRIGDGTNYNKCYIDGIAGVSVSNKTVVTQNSSTKQLGADSISSFALIASVNTFTAAQGCAFVTLTDAATVAIDSSLGNNFNLTLGGNRTLGVPTNMVAGRSGVITVRQDITGSRTLAYSWVYEFIGNVAPVLSTGKLVKDQLNYNINSYSTSTVTVTIATPAVMTWTAHGLVSGQRIQLTTTGALPTGLSANTTYWVTVINANTFNLSTSLANAQAGIFIATSGSQSGVHTAVNASITVTINPGIA